MRKVIFIRHSQTKHQPGKSSHTWILNDIGRERCLKLAEALRPIGITRIFTSEEQKAILTGQLTAEKLGIPCESAPDLGETKRDTIPFYPDVADFNNAIREAMAQPDELIFGEETFTDARTRFAKRIDALLEQYPDDVLAITTHGTVLSLYLAHITGGDVYHIWDSLGMPAYAVLDMDARKLEQLVNIE